MGLSYVRGGFHFSLAGPRQRLPVHRLVLGDAREAGELEHLSAGTDSAGEEALQLPEAAPDKAEVARLTEENQVLREQVSKR